MNGPPVAVLVVGGDGTASVSREWHALTHRLLPPTPPDGWLTAIHPDDRPSAAAALEHADGGRDAACDVRLLGGNGSIVTGARWVVHHPPGWPPGANVIVLAPHP